jgi:hypothetical protein
MVPNLKTLLARQQLEADAADEEIRSLRDQLGMAEEQIEVMREIYEKHKLDSDELAKDPLVNPHVNIGARMRMAAEALKELREALEATTGTKNVCLPVKRWRANRELLDRSYPIGSNDPTW